MGRGRTLRPPSKWRPRDSPLGRLMSIACLRSGPTTSKDDVQQFDAAEIEALKYYVYVYSDPRNGEPFYIGKGIGNRAFAHLFDGGESAKTARIREIRSQGLKPIIELLAYGLDEDTAFKVEAAAIDLVGFDNLTNQVLGHGARQFGRMHIDEVHGKLASHPVERFDHDCVLIKIRESYAESHRLDAQALYDATRGTWRVSLDSARKAKYALAVHNGIVREVYLIAQWLPAGSTMYAGGEASGPVDRYEFVGRIADDEVRSHYRWRSVAHLYPKGAANPIMYVGPHREPVVAIDETDAAGEAAITPTAVIVAARRAYPFYLRHAAYVCQADRPFRDDAGHLGFYADGEIKPEIASIEYVENAVPFTAEEAAARRSSEHAAVRRTAEIIEAELAAGMPPGETHKVMLLSDVDGEDTIRMPQPIVNDTVAASGRPWAWTLGQRYVQLGALVSGVERTSQLNGSSAS